MKVYQSGSIDEYMKALREIIDDCGTGIIQSGKDSNFYAVMDAGDGIKVISAGRMYGGDMVNGKFDMRNAGYFLNGVIYDYGYDIAPYMSIKMDEYNNGDILLFRDSDFVNNVTEGLAAKVSNIISEEYARLYPDMDSIPLTEQEKQRLNCYANVDDVRRTILQGKENGTFSFSLDSTEFTRREVLLYIYDISKQYDYAEQIKARHDAKIKTSLYIYYKRQEVAKEFNGNMNTEDKIFLKIKDAMSKLNAKKVKVYLDGRDDMLQYSVKRDYPNLTIEGKEIIFSYDRESLMYYECYFSGYGVLLDAPYVKNRWGDNHRERILDEFQPSDIRKITYGKKVVYSKD